MKYLALCLFLLPWLLPAQTRVDPRNTYVRLICVVPLTGAGTPEDPKRPQHVPWPLARPDSRTGIIAFTQLPSDDGTTALVEFVARDRAAFAAILTDKQVKAFEKGKVKKEDVDKELKKYRKDFDLDRFGVVMP